eukprot:7984147-Lingulodinium_polyedra.AAC.1
MRASCCSVYACRVDAHIAACPAARMLRAYARVAACDAACAYATACKDIAAYRYGGACAQAADAARPW